MGLTHELLLKLFPLSIGEAGVNLSAIASSIISEVRYFVTKSTGTEVRAVNVFVDSMSVD